MNKTPIANRMHIGIFGKRNAGKSTFINALTSQDIALVSNVPGTTTDPVYKTMEILPIGPVVIIDTAGIDDVGELGNLRVSKTRNVLAKTDFVFYLVSSETGIDEYDENFLKDLKKKNILTMVVFNKTDIEDISDEEVKMITKKLEIPCAKVSSKEKVGIDNIKKLLGEHAKYDQGDLSIIGDLINPGDIVLLVTPIDKAAPKNRLILPQQQVIRDCIDNDAIAMVTKEYELAEAIDSLKKKPALVVTDSQAFLKVTADTPMDIPLTSFSILFARYKGELMEMVKGLSMLKKVKKGSKILIVEGCTHHRQSDDIGTVKIPRWIRQHTGVDVEFEWASGPNFPQDVSSYDGIIHCGACMLNAKEMKNRINQAIENEILITNYGMLIGYLQGVLERAVKPFPEVHMYVQENL